jgi:hypothetical protein
MDLLTDEHQLACLNISTGLYSQGYQLHIVCCCLEQISIGSLNLLFLLCGLFIILKFAFQDILFSCGKFDFYYSICFADLESPSESRS